MDCRINTKMTIRHAYPFGYHQCEDSEKEDGVLQCVLYLLMISFVVNYVNNMAKRKKYTTCALHINLQSDFVVPFQLSAGIIEKRPM
jgi:hypothetical protein